MDYGVFERRAIELLFKTDQKLTTTVAAYRIGCPVEVARKHLDTMATNEILTLEVDDRGLLYYEMPGRPTATNEALSWDPAAQLPAPTPFGAPRPPQQMISYEVPTGAGPMHVQINNHPAQVVVLAERKSPALAFFAGLLLGPLGMLYSTVGGALVMFIINIFMFAATAGVGLLLTVPAGAIWAAAAASAHNDKLQRLAQ